MPFAGVPKGSETEKKIDRCVREVMKRQPNLGESRAIAICRASIEKKSEGAMPKTKKGKTARQRRKEERKHFAQQPEALEVAEDPKADIRAEEDVYYSFEDFVDDNPEDDDADIEEDEKRFVSVGELIEAVDFTPPTDFEELDAEREAAEQAQKVRRIGWDADRLLSNIVHSPVLDPEEKEEKIKKVGSDFASRLTNVVQDEKEWEPSEKELELAEAEMWASLNGKVGLIERAKAKLTSAARSNLPDSAFACILRGGEKDEGGRTTPRSLRRLPIHDKAHVRNALARLPQMMKRGGDSAKAARCGRSKVMAAAKEMGIGKAGKKNLNGILVEKDTDDVYRWIGWVSNNFRDRDGEIITDEAHKEFVSYLDANPDRAPEFWSWHTKGTARESKVDAWLYHEGFLIMSGPLTDTEAYRLMKTISSDDVGMSHGFFCKKDSSDPSIITKYRTYEVSDLPLNKASNIWTNIGTHMKEVTSMSNEQIEYLKRVTSEEFIDGLLAEAEENKELLEELGVESKETDETSEEEAKELTKKEEKVVEKVFEQDYPEIKEFMDTAAKLMPVMAQEIVNLKEKLAKTEEKQEDKLAEMLEAPLGKRVKAMDERPSVKKDNIMPEEEKTPEGPTSKPGEEEDWFYPGSSIEREEAGGV